MFSWAKIVRDRTIARANTRAGSDAHTQYEVTILFPLSQSCVIRTNYTVITLHKSQNTKQKRKATFDVISPNIVVAKKTEYVEFWL
jgi:hypothetical protein